MRTPVLWPMLLIPGRVRATLRYAWCVPELFVVQPRALRLEDTSSPSSMSATQHGMRLGRVSCRRLDQLRQAGQAVLAQR
jgi:hypothetical protein